MLKEADWQIHKLEDSGGDASAWRTYRQKLREITDASDIYNVTWPTKTFIGVPNEQKFRQKSNRKGSDPYIIGSSKLATDSSNNFNILDNSDAPKKLISETEIGDSSNKVIIVQGSDNKVGIPNSSIWSISY